MRTIDHGATSSDVSASAIAVPSKVQRVTAPSTRHTSAESLTANSTSRSPRGWIVSSRGAKAPRSAYQTGLRRPAPSTAAQLVTGQQSLSCHPIVPMHVPRSDRKCSTPVRTARAWLSCVAQSQASKSAGVEVLGEAARELAVAVGRLLVVQHPGRVGASGSSEIGAAQRRPRRRRLPAELGDEPRVRSRYR